MAPSAYKDSAAICACRSPVLVSISLWSSWWLANVMKAALYYMSVVPSVTLCWSFCLNECQHFQMGIEWRLLCSRRQATMLLNIMLHFTDHMLVCQVPYTMLRTEVFSIHLTSQRQGVKQRTISGRNCIILSQMQLSHVCSLLLHVMSRAVIYIIQGSIKWSAANAQ